MVKSHCQVQQIVMDNMENRKNGRVGAGNWLLKVHPVTLQVVSRLFEIG